MDTLSHEQQDKLDRCPPALQAIVEEFRDATARERLELLLEYADSLPPLPAEYAAARERMEQVHECQSPVFLATRLEADERGDHVVFAVDVPPESPTVRGYASILLEGLKGATPAQVLAVPDDIYLLLGLVEVITPQRVRGLHALLGYMKKQVRGLQPGN